MHAATASMSCRNSQATSAAPGSGNVLSISTFMPTVPQSTSPLVDAKCLALLPHAIRRMRHVHVCDAPGGKRIDDRVAEARNAADVRRFRDALGADRMM